MLTPFYVRCTQGQMVLKPDATGILHYQLNEHEVTDLTKGAIYQVIAVEHQCYRVVDDSGEDYLYPAHFFVSLTEQPYKPNDGAGEIGIPPSN